MSLNLDQPLDTPQSVAMTTEDILVCTAGQALSMATQLKRRILVGLVGGPGSGKSTLADLMVTTLNSMCAHSATTFGMDGFHRKHADLVASGEAEQKGAPHTFDSYGFLRALRRIKVTRQDFAIPTYSREIEDVVDNGHIVPGNVPIVVVEGNYLLLETDGWRDVAGLLDISVFLEVERETVRKRLLKRHAEHGLFSHERNQSHVNNVDLPNFDLVDASKHRADQIFYVSDAG